MKNKGFFLTFEGGEGAGKSTLIESLESFLKDKGFQIVKTREPGGTPFGEKIRSILLDHASNFLSPQAELCLFLASRSQHIKEVIAPALKEGKIVLCDRFNDSSIAYQGGGRGLGIEKVSSFCDFIVEGLKPDLTFYLDIDPKIGLERITHASNHHDRIESEVASFHQNIRKAYHQIAQQDKKRLKVIDATKSKASVFKEVMDQISETLNLF